MQGVTGKKKTSHAKSLSSIRIRKVDKETGSSKLVESIGCIRGEKEGLSNDQEERVEKVKRRTYTKK